MAKKSSGAEGPSADSTAPKSNVPAKLNTTPKKLQPYKGDPMESLSEQGALVLAQATSEFGLSATTLPRAHVAPGGIGQFIVPLAEGDTASKTIVGVILAYQGNRKAFWASKETTGKPPSCFSNDGRHGHGINTMEKEAKSGEHECAKCHQNIFGSDPKGGKGKACKDMAILMIATDFSLLPLVLTIPPTSLSPAGQYMTRLLGRPCQYFHVVTKFTLAEKVSATGQKYNTITMEFVGDLNEDQKSIADRMRTQAIELIRAGIVQPEYQVESAG